MKFINGTKLDDRVLRTDWDAGFEEGRQFGRGRNGGQVRDEYRQDYDPDRGGFGHLLARGISLPCKYLPHGCVSPALSHHLCGMHSCGPEARPRLIEDTNEIC